MRGGVCISEKTNSSARWKYGLYAVCAGIGAVFLCFAFAVVRYSTAGDAASAVAPALTAIGTLAGAYFGVQVGSAGREEADARREDAQSLSLKLAAVADPDRAIRVLGLGPDDGGPGGGLSGSALGAGEQDDGLSTDSGMYVSNDMHLDPEGEELPAHDTTGVKKAPPAAKPKDKEMTAGSPNII